MPVAPLLRSFTRFEDIEPARAELLAAGVPADAIQARMLGDEAGPVEGNFISGNGRESVGGNGPEGVLAGGRMSYEQNFEHAPTRGLHLLVIQPGDASQRDVAAAILDRYDTADADAGGTAAA